MTLEITSRHCKKILGVIINYSSTRNRFQNHLDIQH
jgi:hypothetical protein